MTKKDRLADAEADVNLAALTVKKAQHEYARARLEVMDAEANIAQEQIFYDMAVRTYERLKGEEDG